MRRSPRRTLALCLLVALSNGCKKPIPETPRNHCSDGKDCGENAYCSTPRQICVTRFVSTPYTVVLQAAHRSSDTGEVRRYTFTPFLLQQSDVSRDLNMPSGRTLRGFVGYRDGDSMRPVRVELTFMPKSKHEGAPVAPVVITSGDRVDPRDQTNLRVTLDAETHYDVVAVPLGAASALLPPARFTLDTAGEERFDFVFPAVASLRVLLIDAANTPLQNLWVRMIDAKTREVLSSTGVVDKDGKLELFVQPDVLRGDAYRFEVNLDPVHAWETVIEVDPSRVDSSENNTLVLPVVPRFVRFRGTVEKSAEVRLSSTDLTFRSVFPIPTVPGEVGGRDFCRSTLPGDQRPPFLCRSVRRGTTDDNGRFEVSLLPGDYRVFLSPATDAENATRATTLAGDAVIETQAADLPQQGQVYVLAAGSIYRGVVRSAQSVLGNVLVRGIALGTVGALDEIAAYNRTSETLTDSKGRFRLAVDLGYYDLVASPLPTSGYPWLYMPYQLVDHGNTSLDAGGLVLPFPVLIAGTLQENGEVAALASIDAFALVPGEGGQRGVPIARTTTDEMGRYTLLVAPNIPSGKTPVQARDAGAE